MFLTEPNKCFYLRYIEVALNNLFEQQQQQKSGRKYHYGKIINGDFCVESFLVWSSDSSGKEWKAIAEAHTVIEGKKHSI